MGTMWAFTDFCTTAYGINKHAGYIAAGVDSFHPGGANFAMADGSAQFFSENTDQLTLVVFDDPRWGGTGQWILGISSDC